MPVESTALTCTPSSLLSAKACLNCLSEKEIKAILVYAMNDTAGLTLPQLLTNSGCFTCMGKKDMLVALVAMILNELVPTQSINDLRNNSNCLACASDKQLEAAFVYLFCNTFQISPV